MTDTDFITAMQQGLPPITPPVSPDADIDQQEAVYGICAEGEEHER